MRRRDFFKKIGRLAVQCYLLGAVPRVPSYASLWAAALPSVESLRHLVASDGDVLAASDATDSPYKQHRDGYNLRVPSAPLAIVRAKNAHAVIKAIQWAREHSVPLHIRGGGHSYEGFSHGSGIVIDTKRMHTITVDGPAMRARIESGALLGHVSEALSRQHLALPAGTCPSVGIVGLATGGGFGLLSRKLGLTCDNLRSLEMIDADGKTVRASAEENPDLFWACRGGGGGHFGIITALEFHVHPIDHVVIFSLRWPADRAKAVFKAWQAWAPHTVDALTCLLSLSASPGKIHAIRCEGEFIGDEADLRKVLRPITHAMTPERFTVTRLPYNKAVAYFAGAKAPPPVFFKAKSSYAKAPISDEGLETLLRGAVALPFAIAVMCDAYGGAINRVGTDDTAFFHRGGTLFSMQYYTQWSHPEQSASRMAAIKAFYDKVRPFVTNAAYVNYCDLELHDWPEAYWGSNFTKLVQVKAAYDPANIFRHAQSIPVG